MLIMCSIFILHVCIMDLSKLYLQDYVEAFAQKKYAHTILSSIYQYNFFCSVLISGFIVCLINYIPVNDVIHKLV